MELDAKAKKKLRAQVCERKRRLKQILDFVQTFVPKHGRETKNETHTTHTTVVRELDDFNGLKIEWSTGNTMMGGNHIKIWYGSPPANKSLVFWANYWDGANFERWAVTTFSKERGWQCAFTYAAGHSEKILEKIRVAQARARTAMGKDEKAKASEAALLAMAGKLGL